MKASNVNVESVALRFGIMTAAGLISYFLLMKLIGWVHIVELRVLNFLILSAGVTVAINYFKKIKQGDLAYLKGIGVGLLTAMIGVVIFAFFLVMYLLFLDPGFMEMIQQQESFGQYLDPLTVGFTIIVEGFGSGYLITFIVMQYLKRSHFQKSTG
ncbi:MAG: DUF4199 domain-containing protein [Cyclobacteriaceae bacterium]